MAEFTEYAPGTPCWVDLQTPDVAGSAEFYGKLFGWDRQEGPPEAGGYAMFLKGGKIVAGVMPKMDPQGPTAWSTYVCVSDADATTAKVKANGGTVIVEPMDVMAAGRMAFYIDPTGAAIGVWQPGDMKGAQLANETGAFGWNECLTRDVDRAKSFYSAVFGWRPHVLEDMGGYTLFEIDGGRPIGGCMAMPAEVPTVVPSNWVTYFGVVDADAAAAKVKELGGSVMVPPTDIPNVGRFAVVSDPQGASFAIIKSTPQAAAS